MERETLIQLLSAVPGEAFEACGAALGQGADFIVWDDTVPADHLARTYARRERHMRKVGTPTLGFAETVARLEASAQTPLRIGQAMVEDPPWHFQLFLNDTSSAVVACIAIDQR